MDSWIIDCRARQAWPLFSLPRQCRGKVVRGPPILVLPSAAFQPKPASYAMPYICVFLIACVLSKTVW